MLVQCVSVPEETNFIIETLNHLTYVLLNLWCDELALHASEVASISPIIANSHAEDFQILRVSLNILRQSCQLTPAAFASTSTMVPTGLVQLFSENILEVPDALDQLKLLPKTQP